MPKKSPSVTLFLSLHLSHLESFSPSSHHCLCSIHCYSTSIWLSLAQINIIIAISIHLNTQICSDCLYHAGISPILTLLSCSTSIEPWDECYVFFSLAPQTPHHSHSTPTRPPPHPYPLAPYPRLFTLLLLLSFPSPLTLLNTKPCRSMDLP